MKSVLQPGLETLKRKRLEIKKLLEGPGRFELHRQGRKSIILERQDLEEELRRIDQAIQSQKQFHKKFSEGISLKRPDHFEFFYRDILKNLRNKPTKQRAGRASAQKRKKKAESWKNKFIHYRKQYRFDHQKLDRVITDSEIIKRFIRLNKKAPANKSTYYSYLRK